MLNKFICDADLNVELLVCMQKPRASGGDWYNDLQVEITSDDTPGQMLQIEAGEEIQTVTILPNETVSVVVPRSCWNYGGVTEISLIKTLATVGLFTITFPEQLEGLAMINVDENQANVYHMRGSSESFEDVDKEITQIKQETTVIEQQVQDAIKESDIMISTTDIGEGADLAANHFWLVYE